jgi:hypothetical protein
MKVSSESGDFVELERDLAEVGSPDLALGVRIRRAGFACESRVWISRTDWFAFAQDLTILEECRQGIARVEAMSPGELQLTVRSIGRLGDVGIEGSAGVRTFDTEVLLTFSVFGFDPSQLVTLAREAREIAAALG